VIRHSGTHFDPHLAALAEEIFLDAPIDVLSGPVRIEEL
jgi:hypothetical protein